MELEKNNEILNNLSGMRYEHALTIKKIIEKNNFSNCLELGFAHGKSSCYIASILKDLGGGHLTTIDLRSRQRLKPNIEELLEKLKLTDYVTPYYERKSYTWRLMKLIEEYDEPIFDFCFIDGSHTWYDDGFAFFLVDKLLKPGGLIMMASLNWSYGSSSMKNSAFVQSMDEDEIDLPHIKQVYELLVKTHPAYEKFEVIEDKIALAFKKKVITPESIHESQLNTSNYLKTHHFTKLNNEIKELTSKLDRLENNYNGFSKKTIEYLDSENFLFNTLFLDYKFEPNTLLNNLQTLESEFVLFISNICQKYGLGWWLDGGNLLGAVRHGNFIPWDDDMDIAMMRKDYHKLNEVLKQEINNYNLSDTIQVAYRYRRSHGKAVNSFIQLFIKEKINGTETIVAGVDIFPFDFLCETNKSIGINYERAKRSFYRSLAKGSDRSQIYMGHNKEEFIEEYFNNLNLSYDKQAYIVPGVEGSFGYNGTNQYELVVLDSDEMLPFSKIKFGNYEFSCPKNPDYYLKSVYGEYMSIPKSIRTHGRINEFRTVPNANEIFEKYIRKLQIVNGNFEK